MKKLALILGVLSLVACTDQKVVNYNTARLDNIEAYLANNKAVKPSENLEKLVEEGKVEYTEEYLSLEKEADKWKRERAQEIKNLDITNIEAPKEMTIVLDERALNFDFDKSVVKPQYFEMLNNLKDFIEQNNYELTIEGHTDSIGSNQYNIGLSRRRAEAVKAKLIEFGLPEDRIVGIEAKGEEYPVATNETPEGRLQNRRVEFRLVQR